MAQRNEPIPALTGLRFFAAFAIVLNHLLPHLIKLNQDGGVPDTVQRLALLGMSTFFVLSGFVMQYNYGGRVGALEPRAVWEFFVARFSRLYPLFALLLLFDLVMSNPVLYSETSTMKTYLRMLPVLLTGTQTWTFWFPGGVPGFTPYYYSVVTWSISTEFFLYLFYPLVAVLLLNFRNRFASVALMVIATVLATWVIYLVKSNLAAVDSFAADRFGVLAPANNPFSNWLWYFSPYGRLPEFLTGCLIAQCVMLLRDRVPGPIERVSSSVLTAVSLIYIGLHLEPFTLAKVPGGELAYWTGMLPAISYLIFAAARYQGQFSRVLSKKPIVALGEASYSIYMIHFIVITAFGAQGALAFTETRLAVLILRGLVIIGLIFVLAMASHKYIEMPAQRWLRSRLSRPRTRPVGAPAE